MIPMGWGFGWDFLGLRSFFGVGRSFFTGDIDALLRLTHPTLDVVGLFWGVGEDLGDRLGDEGGLVDPDEMAAV